MFKKSLIFVAVLASLTLATSQATSQAAIDDHILTGTTRGDHAAICNAVIASNILKRQRADRYINNDQYKIRVQAILKRLQSRGIRVR